MKAAVVEPRWGEDAEEGLTHSDVVVLGEHPAVEVRGHIIADVHLCQVLVVVHLVVRDADALLEGNGVVVLTCSSTSAGMSPSMLGGWEMQKPKHVYPYTAREDKHAHGSCGAIQGRMAPLQIHEAWHS